MATRTPRLLTHWRCRRWLCGYCCPPIKCCLRSLFYSLSIGYMIHTFTTKEAALGQVEHGIAVGIIAAREAGKAEERLWGCSIALLSDKRQLLWTAS